MAAETPPFPGGQKVQIDEKQTAQIPVVAEELQTGIRRVNTGGVRVHKTVREHEEIIDQPLRRENIEVRRVIKDEVVSGPLPVRQEGDITIVPVVKEVLKVERQWVLTEELHLIKHRTEEREQQRITLQREEPDIQRIDAEGNEVGPAEVRDLAPAATATAPPITTKHRLGARPTPAVRKNKIVK